MCLICVKDCGPGNIVLIGYPNCPQLHNLHIMAALIKLRYKYQGSDGLRMLFRVRKTMRQRWARLTVKKYLKTEAYRQLTIASHERNRTKLIAWLEKKGVH